MLVIQRTPRPAILSIFTTTSRGKIFLSFVLRLFNGFKGSRSLLGVWNPFGLFLPQLFRSHQVFACRSRCTDCFLFLS